MPNQVIRKPHNADGTTANRKHITLAGGYKLALTIRDVPSPMPIPLATPKETRGVPAASVVAFGVGGVAMATAAVFGVRAVQAKDSYDATPTREAQSDFYQSRDLCNVSLGVGVVAALIGVALYVVVPSRRVVARAGGLSLAY